ncbi:major facilitator superfamily domain-containing protein [Abortiporus biennis]|nr:major facilitator superfamily domain-containing protein [Abortiporus biennis]
MANDEEATLYEKDGQRVAIRALGQTTEPVDSRLDSAARLSNKFVAGTIQNKEDERRTKSSETESDEHLYVEFEKDDPRNPYNFSYTRKWAITIVACLFTSLGGAAASTYNLGFPSMIRDLNCTQFQATTGLPLYTLGFATIPLVTTSFSEEVGRQPLYLVSAIGLAAMHLMIALAHNIQTVLIGRFLAGAFGSTSSAMVGGSIAEIWHPHERGVPMAIFSIAAIASTGLGPLAAGWIEMNPHLGWRWIQWIHLIVTGALILAIPTIMKETRASVLLTRIARKLRKETGDNRYKSRAEVERASLKTLIYVSCTRPLWIGFAWGVVYCLIASISPVFKTLHNFNNGETGTVFITFLIGSLLGYATTLYQEKLYSKHFATRGPEARLYTAMFAAILFPASMFIYAWCTFPNVHWISLAIALTLFLWACFIMYLAVFSYLADCYGPFASSALAGQTLSRNIMGMVFPLFTQQMFAALTYKWANTLFALIATLMIPIPFVLFWKGKEIRAKSKFASMVMEKH